AARRHEQRPRVQLARRRRHVELALATSDDNHSNLAFTNAKKPAPQLQTMNVQQSALTASLNACGQLIAAPVHESASGRPRTGDSTSPPSDTTAARPRRPGASPARGRTPCDRHPSHGRPRPVAPSYDATLP